VESILAEVAAAQAARFDETGEYAAALSSLALWPHDGTESELHVFRSSFSLPVDLAAAAGGWAATVSLTDIGTTCHIAVGAVEPSLPDIAPGMPACFADPSVGA